MPGKMEVDFGDLAFECILLPSTLDSKVFTGTPENFQTRRFAFGVLRELLSQLNTVTKTQLATSSETGPQQADVGSLKKKALIQLMVVRIASYLSWDIKDLNDVPALQLLLLGKKLELHS